MLMLDIILHHDLTMLYAVHTITNQPGDIERGLQA